ncbi:hypothetical protein CEXT_689771 [Caerostris extrusa]|uniref:Phospholipase A2-like central domain-containing protein n=1 Tax=Caerostris extrusa TaxID=172846 RepID=A0AAV4X7A4_CAEEX|nr:hypothetical protein CEXT_689771 [Caerostris extrusa]
MGFLVSILVFAVICCVPAHFSPFRENVFVLQDPNSEDNRTVVVVTWTDDERQRCEFFSDEQLTDEVRKLSKDQLILKPSREEMGNLLEECIMFSFNRKRRAAYENEESGTRRFLGRRRKSSRDVRDESDEETTNASYEAPKRRRTTTPRTTTEDNSTKWCGAGDVSKHDDDLGFHQDTDRCCRAHDKCDDIIEGGGTKYNLTNKSPFTKLICKCDDDFYDCLSRVNSVTSNTIGNTYFNVLKRPCYELGYPKSKKCKKYRTFLKLTCSEYEDDTSKGKSYQWRSAKKYKKLPFPGPLDITLPF